MTKNELIDEILKRTTFKSDNERRRYMHKLYTQRKYVLEEILHKFAKSDYVIVRKLWLILNGKLLVYYHSEF